MPKKDFRALLVDTRSIQRYIFAGSRLKMSVGASFLVSSLYEEVLFPLLSREAAGGFDVSAPFAPERIAPDGAALAYEGGGNALVVFDASFSEARLKEIVTRFTAELLIKRPGLHVGAAVGTITLGEAAAERETVDALFKKLKLNQATVFPQVSVPRTGLTLICPETGETANFYDGSHELGKGQLFLSQEMAAKGRAARRSTEALMELYPDITSRFAFPMDFDDLGQRRTESDIAIVHIDGNNMGQKFRGKDLRARALLSRELKEKTAAAFGKVLALAASEYDSYDSFLTLGVDRETKKPFLPIRPIIIGGDDVTFVCAGRLALRYAECFMKNMLEWAPKSVKSEEARRVDCCAGVAFLKTSYPFFRGYRLAEELCDAAKAKMREHGAGVWLDFAILHGEQPPTLEGLRASEYQGRRGSLHFGPYELFSDAKSKNVHQLRYLLAAVHEFKGSCMPHGKAKELRLVLSLGEREMQLFLKQLERMDSLDEKISYRLPQVEAWAAYESFENACWRRGETPYVDAIELMDLVPEEAAK